MAETAWVQRDVEGFVTRLAAFYDDLSPGARQIFVDLLREPMHKSEDVSGYSMMGAAVPTAVITAAVTDYLLRRAADVEPAHG